MNCIPNDQTVRRRSWILNLASTTLTDQLATTVVNAVIEAIEEIVEPDQVDVEASEESHVVAEVELRLPMSTTNRLSHLWAKDGSSSRAPTPSNHICGKNKKK